MNGCGCDDVPIVLEKAREFLDEMLLEAGITDKAIVQKCDGILDDLYTSEYPEDRTLGYSQSLTVAQSLAAIVIEQVTDDQDD